MTVAAVTGVGRPTEAEVFCEDMALDSYVGSAAADNGVMSAWPDSAAKESASTTDPRRGS
ncbi:hypothetical protein GCM10012280_03240 [Wenjunlia tyrosinilytica]|uniref:Uncharacterized protein n=1 Tax=Wenjunlia tyrosinilytica TaxID=1544741 RepID=A0A917ZCE9_9ACTN|nr:hypothetical protein GCM10012280_03240 [Wenjunlia tyrosinilytica]